MERQKFRSLTLFADIIILAVSFLIATEFKPSGIRGYVPSHAPFFLILIVLWIFISILNGKMHRGKVINFSTLFYRVVVSNLISVSMAALIMYAFREIQYSRTVVFGTALIATILELIIGSVYIAYKKASIQNYDDYETYKRYKKPSEYELVSKSNGNGNGNGNGNNHSNHTVNPGIYKVIERESGPEMAKAVIQMTGNNLNHRSAVLSTTTIFNITSLPEEQYSYLINLHRINDIKKIDDFIDAVNSKLEMNGYFFCCVETKDQRKARILKKFPPVINYIYYSLDFVVKRILPKLKITRPMYFFLTRGENAVISRAEALGRLSRGGFTIMQESFLGNQLCIEARKTSAPVAVGENVYGPLIALPRIGQHGQLIKVYKLRTMHPYSEYIQDYIYQLYDLQAGGKFQNDFRITSWGAVCRKIWIDEFPMLINLLKGEMKLIGVRPLSQHYYELYNQDVRERRIKYKPGLLPPYYADLPAGLEEIQKSELSYLDSYDKNPIITDFRYFLKSTGNIFFRRARSN